MAQYLEFSVGGSVVLVDTGEPDGDVAAGGGLVDLLRPAMEVVAVMLDLAGSVAGQTPVDVTFGLSTDAMGRAVLTGPDTPGLFRLSVRLNATPDPAQLGLPGVSRSR